MLLWLMNMGFAGGIAGLEAPNQRTVEVGLHDRNPSVGADDVCEVGNDGRLFIVDPHETGG